MLRLDVVDHRCRRHAAFVLARHTEAAVALQDPIADLPPRLAIPSRAGARAAALRVSNTLGLAPKRQRSLELDSSLRPRLGAPARVQHHARDAVDPEPGVPEAGVGCIQDSTRFTLTRSFVAPIARGGARGEVLAADGQSTVSRR